MKRGVIASIVLLAILLGLPLAGHAGAGGPDAVAGPVFPGGYAIAAGGSSAAAAAPIRLRVGTFVPARGEALDLPPRLRAPGDGSGAGYYIVQFAGPIQGEWKERVMRLGGTFLEYVPDFAFVVYLEESARQELETVPEVSWVGPYHPAYRLSPDLAEKQGRLDLIVLTFPTAVIDEVASQISALGAQVQDSAANSAGGLLRLSIDASQLTALAHVPGVHWIEPFYERVLLNDVARSDSIMAAESTWANLGLYGEGQVVAIADTGLDTGNLSTIHQDFRGSPTGCSGTSRIVATFARGTANNWSDGCCPGTVNGGGHGTHVTGSVLGNGCQSGSGGAPDYAGSHAGLAPQAGVVMQSVMGNRGNLYCNLIPSLACALTGLPSDLNDLYSQAQGVGAHIHTNSWGASVNGQYTTDSRNTDLYMWNHKDYTILFAASNDGIDANSDGVIDLDSMGAPATAKNCITVGASENYRLYGGVNPEHDGDPWNELQCTGDPGACSPPPAPYWGNCWPSDYQASPVCSDRLSDNAGGIVAFSSRGPCDDGRIKPDVVAPGSNVLSTRSQASGVGGGWGDGENQYYQFMGGTSMSAPLTAGATALVREFFSDQGIVPSSALIKATLIHGAAELYPGQYGGGPTQEIPTTRPNDVEGWGRVDLIDSLLPSGGRRIEYYDYYGGGRPGLRTGEYDTWTYDVGDGGLPFRSTLVWTDYPGSTASGGALVNDLDLTVTDRNAVVHYPNRGASADRTNNVEGIDLLNPIPTGEYVVRVQGYNVAQEGTVPRQNYAAVDSGAMSSVVAAESRRNMPAGDQALLLYGKTGIEMDFGSGPGGNVTVTMTKTAPLQPPPAGRAFLNVSWNITSGMAGFSTGIVFHYADGDVPAGMDEGTVVAYRWNDGTSAWENMGGTVDTNANAVTVDGVTAFSGWALGGASPTAVKLATFSAAPSADGILVIWETASERDNLGFNLYRSLSAEALGERLNVVLIPSKSPGAGQGASYAFLDDTVVPGLTYYYTLEDVSNLDLRTRYGPAVVTLWRVFLPLVTRP